MGEGKGNRDRQESDTTEQNAGPGSNAHPMTRLTVAIEEPVERLERERKGAFCEVGGAIAGAEVPKVDQAAE